MITVKKLVTLAAVPFLFEACKTSGNTGRSFAKDDLHAGNGQAVYEPYPNAVLPQSTSGLNNSSLAGQPLTTERRSVKVLTDAEAAPYSPGPNDVMIYNFRHNDTYWIAKIPGLKDLTSPLVAQVILQAEHFPPEWAAGHNELRLTLRDGAAILLYDQVKPAPANPQPTWAISDIVLSAEAVPVKGKSFDIVKGLQNNFALGNTIVSVEQKGTYMLKQNHRVQQYPLPIARVAGDDAEAQTILNNILATAVQTSDTNGMGKLYNTGAASCVTEMWDLIDAATAQLRTDGKARLPKKVWFTNVQLNPLNGMLPLDIPRNMKSRGLANTPTETLPNLDVDPTYTTPSSRKLTQPVPVAQNNDGSDENITPVVDSALSVVQADKTSTNDSDYVDGPTDVSLPADQASYGQ